MQDYQECLTCKTPSVVIGPTVRRDECNLGDEKIWWPNDLGLLPLCEIFDHNEAKGNIAKEGRIKQCILCGHVAVETIEQ